MGETQEEILEEQPEEEIPEEAPEEEPVEEVEIQEDEFLGIDKVKEVLAETSLPKHVQIHVAYSGRFSSEEELKEVAEAELEYIKTVTRSGKPYGLDKKEPKKQDKSNKFAEAEEAKNKLAADFMNIKKK